MNLVGKIFTVLILVLAVVFSAFAVAVHATHKSWRDVAMSEEVNPITRQVGVVRQLKETRAGSESLKGQMEKVEKELEAERTAKREATKNLETERDQLKSTNADAQKERDALDQKLREAVAALETTSTSAKTYYQEQKSLEARIEKAQKERDTAFKELVQLQDQVNQEVSEDQRLKGLVAKNEQDLAKLREYVRAKGDDPSDPDLIEKTLPPRVDGVVLAAREGGLLEITIGSDVGLRRGHQLDIFRTSAGVVTAVGRCEVVATAAKASVCRLVSGFTKTPPQRGDRVYTKRQ